MKPTEVGAKYGPNPQQECAITTDKGEESPIDILNGMPGYINYLDASDGILAVLELDSVLNMPCATVFKHWTPAGIGTSRGIVSDLERSILDVPADKKLTELSLAFIRAFQTDPKSAMGGFVGLSRKVDYETAMELKPLVLDGVIAPDYEGEALEILKKKKDGNFAIIQMMATLDKLPESALYEERKILGLKFRYKRNNVVPTPDMIKNSIVSENKSIPCATIEDLCVAGIAAKYSQSNSVSMAFDGQTTGVGAGGQSRVDVTELAGRKTDIFYLRSIPEVVALKFKDNVKSQDRLLTKLAYITGDLLRMAGSHPLLANLAEIPKPLLAERKEEYLRTYRDHIALWSDAFFPNRDGIDEANKYGVKYIAHTGIGKYNEDIIKAANEFGMILIEVGKNARFFKH